MNTSHKALASVDTTALENLVYQAVLHAKMDGLIADELRQMFPTLAYSSITMRFCVLDNKGRIYRPGVTRPGDSGRAQMVMYADKYRQRVSDRLRKILGEFAPA